MKDLKCGLIECAYNRAYSCTAKQIRVEANTDCGTFAPNEEKKRRSFEAGEDFAVRDFSVDTFVACGADCVFNKNKKCCANGITVMSERDHAAACMSFIKD